MNYEFILTKFPDKRYALWDRDQPLFMQRVKSGHRVSIYRDEKIGYMWSTIVFPYWADRDKIAFTIKLK